MFKNKDAINFSMLKSQYSKDRLQNRNYQRINFENEIVVTSPSPALANCTIKIDSPALLVKMKDKDFIVFNQMNEQLFGYGNNLFQSAYPFKDYIENNQEYFNEFIGNGGMRFALEKNGNNYTFAGMLCYKSKLQDGHPVYVQEEGNLNKEDVNYISDCIIREDLRGYGLMKDLMLIHIDELQQQNINDVYLRTLQESHMAGLAQNCEFEQTPLKQTVISTTLADDVPGKTVETYEKNGVKLYKKEQERIFFTKRLGLGK